MFYISVIKKKQKKMIHCKFCDTDVFNKNFTRHLQRKHLNVKDVKSIFDYPKNTKERKYALSLLRNDSNFNLYLHGEIRPNRKHSQNFEGDRMKKFYPCGYCKGLFLKNYLRRHAKHCILQKDKKLEKKSQISISQTLIACSTDPTNVISQLNVKEQVS